MDIWDRALAFMDAQILLTAEELGVFDVLARRPAPAETIAQESGLPVDSAQRLLTALCAMGLVHKDSDGTRYSNSAEADAQLVRARPGYIGGMFRHLRCDLYPAWQHFKHALLEGQAQWHRAFPGQEAPHERVHSNPEALRSFMDGMHTITYQPAAEFAAMAPEIRQLRSLVDVGGASGAFVIALAEANPELNGTIYDLPSVKAIAEERVRESGLQDRIAFVAGDFWSQPVPPGADAYSLGFILHDWDDRGQSVILQRVADACAPGALLIIGEYLLNDEKTGPLWVARSDLNMLVAARGRERNAPEYRAWIHRFGFDMERFYLTSTGKCFMLARRRADVPETARGHRAGRAAVTVALRPLEQNA